MKLALLWVGRTRDRNIQEALGRYLERISRYCPVTVTEVREESAADRHAVAESLLKEGRRIRDAVAPGHERILLDAAGREMSSDEFAAFLQTRLNGSAKGVTFIIGGHLGVDDETRRAADQTLSLSRMTFTHEMARLVAAEQIYRALSIINGARYHRQPEGSGRRNDGRWTRSHAKPTKRSSQRSAGS